jgi:hypothetical protein
LQAVEIGSGEDAWREFAQILLAPVAQIHPVPQEMYVLLFGAVGSHLVPVALALRYWGHGDWIDELFAWMSDNLDGIDYEEEQAWIAEQLAQRRAKSPG